MHAIGAQPDGCKTKKIPGGLEMKKSKTQSNTLPSVEHLRECFDYDPNTGILKRKLRNREFYKSDAAYKMSEKRFSGSHNVKVNQQGYLTTRLEGRSYLVHRIAWKMAKGSEPEYIDHENGDRKDNRILNLRSVSKTENAMNRAIQSNSSTGVYGVTISNKVEGFFVYIKKEGVREYLGSTKDFFEACCLRKSAEIRYGFHKNHGRPRAALHCGGKHG
jgi:hypothetical protein